MELKIWGSRGSVPVSGARFMRHGGATTCLEVNLPGAEGETPAHIIMDCGTGLTELGKAWGERGCQALILQSHMHWDHIQGFPFFGPLFRPGMQVHLMAALRETQSFRDVLGAQMTRPTFPIGLDIIPAELVFKNIAVNGQALCGDLQLHWCEAHHPSGGTSWRLDHKGSSLVFSGDTEVKQGHRDDLIELSQDADVLVMDAQYFPDEYAAKEGFGHSTVEDAVLVALEAGVGQLLLTHHDPGHDDITLDRKVALGRRLASGSRLQVDNAYDGQQLLIQGPHQTALRRVAI